VLVIERAFITNGNHINSCRKNLLTEKLVSNDIFCLFILSTCQLRWFFLKTAMFCYLWLKISIRHTNKTCTELVAIDIKDFPVIWLEVPHPIHVFRLLKCWWNGSEWIKAISLPYTPISMFPILTSRWAALSRSHTFNYTNRGHITNYTADCSCAIYDWSSQQKRNQKASYRRARWKLLKDNRRE
jgi:hypothetical protein